MLLIASLLSGCVKTITETKIEYVHPEIPDEILSPCDSIPSGSIPTNGELLMSYISLQTSYMICSAKVHSISSILKSYSSIYDSE